MSKFSFSYSRWAIWKKCPLAYKKKHIDKYPEKHSPALAKGREVHDVIAKWIEAKDGPAPNPIHQFIKLGFHCKRWPASQRKVEEQMAFDRERRPVSWFGKNAFMRFIWDVGLMNHSDPNEVTEVDAIDWKTGKPYGSYTDQMQMFAMPAFWLFPKLERFTGHLIFLDYGENDPHEVTRDQFPLLERTWAGNVAMMEADQAFNPTPSRDACRFCDYHADKGGDCPYGAPL